MSQGPARKEPCALHSWCRGHQDWPITAAFSPATPSVPSSQWLAANWGTSCEGGMWLPPGVSQHQLRTRALCLGTAESLSHYLEWHLVYLEKGPTWFQPTPCTQVMHLSSEHTLQWTQERSPPKAHLSSAVCYTESKGGGGAGTFSGTAQSMYSLTFLFGYKTTQRLTLDVSWFFPPSWSPMF